MLQCVVELGKFEIRVIRLGSIGVDAIKLTGYGEFVTGPPSYRLVIGEFAYSSWISTNTENILFCGHLRNIVRLVFNGRF